MSATIDLLRMALCVATGEPWTWHPERWAYVGPPGWELVEESDWTYSVRCDGRVLARHTYPHGVLFDAWWATLAASVALHRGYARGASGAGGVALSSFPRNNSDDVPATPALEERWKL